MAEAYFAEIRLFPYDRVPKYWARAEGQELPIKDNQALFALFGNSFGGTPGTSFCLPDLRGRVPLCVRAEREHIENPFRLGNIGGVENVSLVHMNLPVHAHDFNACKEVGDTNDATDANVGAVAKDSLTPPNERLLYGPDIGPLADKVSLHPASLSYAGGGAAHENMQPFAVVSYCICLQGNWPSRD